MRRTTRTLLIFLALIASAQAQNTPFDMSPEQPLIQPALPQGGTAPSPAPAAPLEAPGGASRASDAPFNPLGALSPPSPPPAIDAPSSEPIGTTAAASDAAAGFFQYVVPSHQLRLDGEVAERSWVFYASQNQAVVPARLHVGYRNAIVVAPEASNLSVLINGQEVLTTPVRSPETVGKLVIDIPAGLLRTGENLMTFKASQRHRTDCSIVSTYDLWTDVDPASTYLEYLGESANRLAQLDDVRAVGVDQKGTQHIRIIAPAFEQVATSAPIMRLSQALSLIAGMPHQSVSVAPLADAAPSAGELPVFIGTVEELRPLLSTVPAGASTAAVASFQTYPGASGAPALVIAGPTWQSLGALVENLVASVQAERASGSLATRAWSGTDTVMLGSESRISFRDLRVASQEFSGRRFKTSFQVGVPADFYANAYGEGRILLDAAYSPAVLPGSHIDVYVNGTIASTVPISSRGGALLNHLPIKLTLQHFKPGVNEIDIEAILLTEQDAVCMPGTTAQSTARFALFDSSEFYIPDFARIATSPNLSATGGTGFPYGNVGSPISVVLGRVDADTFSSALTFVSKLASTAGTILPVDVMTPSVLTSGSNAIFVGMPSDMPPSVISQLNLQGDGRTSWSHTDVTRNLSDSSAVSVSDWRDRVGGGFFERQGAALSEWAQRNFNLSVAALRLRPAGDGPYMPPDSASMIVAQETSPDGTGSWTAVLSPDTRLLREGVDALAAHEAWQSMTGRVFVLEGADEFSSVPVSQFQFVETVTPSFANWRLIATNWLSDNIMAYGALLVAGALLVGLSTAALLSALGRRE
jgi:hypothetical protein